MCALGTGVMIPEDRRGGAMKSFGLPSDDGTLGVMVCDVMRIDLGWTSLVCWGKEPFLVVAAGALSLP